MGRTRTTKHPARSRLPFPRRQIIRHPAGHLKDASGAAPAAGLRPVLDPPVRAATNMAATRETGDPSHARPKAATTSANPPLTRPRSFRDDTEGSQIRAWFEPPR